MPASSSAASSPPPSRRHRSGPSAGASPRFFGAALLIGCFVLGCDSAFYYPSSTVYRTPNRFGLAWEDVWLRTSDGLRLHGWFLPAVEASGQGAAARGTIVHFHGNAENITNHLPLVAWLPPRGYNVLMFDYRGYGRSEGSVTRAGTIADGHAALDHVLARPDVDRDRVVFYGQSLGGAVAIAVAADRPELRGVIAESTFSSYRAIAARHLQRSLFFAGPAFALAHAVISPGHDPITAAPLLSPRPLFVITAAHDRICFPEMGRELFNAARPPRSLWEAPNSGHLAILHEDGAELQSRVLEWLHQTLAATPAASAGGAP